MSTQQDNGKNIEDEKDNVAELTEKLDNLAVDNTNKANESKPARRGGYGYRGRGRGRGGRTGGRFLPRPPYEEQVKQIEESLKSKKVIETGVNGYVKWFSVRGLYGFIARENAADDKDDFFVHQTAIAKSSTIKYYLRTLAEDEPVVFDIVEGRKGPEAANVTGPDGTNVRGSKRARYLLTNRGSLRRGAARGSATRKPREKGSEEKDKTAAPEEKDKTATPEENEDGETRGKRRPRRARGKLQPSAEKAAKPHEKGDGDTAPAVDGEKKGRRPIRGKGLKKSQVVSQQKQEEAPAKA